MGQARGREQIMLSALQEPISHYAHGVRFGDLLFVSGCTAAGKDGSIRSDDVTEQARDAFQHMKAVLDASGASFADVLKVTIYLTDVNDRPKINPVRQELFGPARPASTLVQVCALAIEGAKVEVEAIVGLSS
jgi:2-iminobutanoate/2-iminopropanoate deaminase